MTPPPSDMGSIPWKPVIPERKYQHLAKVPDPAGRPGAPRLPFPFLRARGPGGCRASLRVSSLSQLESVGLVSFVIQTRVDAPSPA